MATLTSKVVLFFRSASGYGWTETLYYIGSPSNVLTTLAPLASRRKDILAQDCALDHARISTAFARDPYYENLNPAGGFNGNAPVESTADFEALLINLDSQAGGYGRIFLRGVPDLMVTGDNFTPTTDYLAKLNIWMTMLESPTVWAVQSSLTPGPKVRYPITLLTPNSPRGYTFQSSALTVIQGQVLRVHNATITGYNGEKTVVMTELIPGATKYTVGGAKPAVENPLGDNVYVTLVNYNYLGITRVRPERITRRSAGRPFGQRRGRQASTIPLRQ